MNRWSATALIAAALLAPGLARAETLTGVIHATLERDGTVRLHTLPPDDRVIVLRLTTLGRPYQWATLEGHTVVVEGTFNRDGSFAPDLGAMISVLGWMVASPRPNWTVNSDQMGGPAFSPRVAPLPHEDPVQLYFNGDRPEMGQQVWLVGRFLAGSYTFFPRRWSNVTRTAATTGGRPPTASPPEGTTSGGQTR